MKISMSLVAAGALAVPAMVAAQTPVTPVAHHGVNGHAVVRPSAAAGSSVTVRRDGVRTVTVTANDYAFSAPDTMPAGMTEIRLLNRGTEMHHVWMIRLDAGKSMQDLFAVMKPEAPLPSWARDVGGPNTPGPGGESTAIMRLTPGRYAMICVIPSPDGKPHVMKGMAKQVTVVPASPPASTASLQIGSTMTLLDYTFQFSQPLAAGRQMVRVRNVAEQPHEVVFVKLQPGRKVTDVLAWMEKMDGPPPGMPVGGTTPMAKGEENIVALDLAPGDYGLICFVGDAKDGKPHVAHGMMMQFTVAESK